MRLAVPHPGHFAALEAIIEAKEAGGLNEVDEVYMAGSPEMMGSGRATLHSARIADIENQTEYVHQHGITMNVVINPSCLGGHHLTYEGYKLFTSYFEELSNAGVDSVTVAEPCFVELLQDSSMKTLVSCIAHVDSPQRAEFFEYLGADIIAVDTNVNRDFAVLKAITKAVNCEIKVLVNEGCLYKCLFRHAHFNLFSHLTAARSTLLKAQTQSMNIFGDYYFDKCIAIRVRDPSQIIRSPWIRPEDLKEYEVIGIENFKITGRANAVNWIIRCMEVYSRRSFTGNLLELIDCPSELRDAFYVDNELLEGSIKQWGTCRKICNECRYCDKLTEKVLKVDR
ncbi:MAG: U32 family peptidase [Methanophagales archaeon]|nr:U32 family peptidase [Methanophagales archaeon]